MEGVLKRLQELRTESEFKVVFEKAKERPEAAGIEISDKIPGQDPEKYLQVVSTVYRRSQQEKTITLGI